MSQTEALAEIGLVLDEALKTAASEVLGIIVRPDYALFLEGKVVNYSAFDKPETLAKFTVSFMKAWKARRNNIIRVLERDPKLFDLLTGYIENRLKDATGDELVRKFRDEYRFPQYRASHIARNFFETEFKARVLAYVREVLFSIELSMARSSERRLRSMMPIPDESEDLEKDAKRRLAEMERQIKITSDAHSTTMDSIEKSMKMADAVLAKTRRRRRK